MKSPCCCLPVCPRICFCFCFCFLRCTLHVKGKETVRFPRSSCVWLVLTYSQSLHDRSSQFYIQCWAKFFPVLPADGEINTRGISTHCNQNEIVVNFRLLIIILALNQEALNSGRVAEYYRILSINFPRLSRLFLHTNLKAIMTSSSLPPLSSFPTIYLIAAIISFYFMRTLWVITHFSYQTTIWKP